MICIDYVSVQAIQMNKTYSSAVPIMDAPNIHVS